MKKSTDQRHYRAECGYAPQQKLSYLFWELFDYWVDFYGKHNDRDLD